MTTSLVRRARCALPCLAALLLAACQSVTPAPAYAPPTLMALGAVTPSATPDAFAIVPLASATPTATPNPTPPATATPTPTPTPFCANQHGRVESGTFFSQILGRDMPYLAYLPPCYDVVAHRYPVLYLLHGYPFDEHHWDNLGAAEVADLGIRSAAYPPFIIVMPNCDPSPEGIFIHTSGGDRSVEGLVINELLPYIDRTYRTQTQREGRAIGGISRGGVWSLEIGFLHSDLFAIVGGHSAALSLNYPHPLYDPYNMVANPSLKTLRIWLDAGDADWARTGTAQLHQLLEENGVPHEYVVGEGDHVDDYWSQMMPAYLAFYTASWQ